MPPLRGLLSVPVAFGVTGKETSKEPSPPSTTSPPEAEHVSVLLAIAQEIVPVPETFVRLATEGVP